MKTTLGEYLELWRIKQQHHLQRYATESPNDYEPKLFDLIFTAKKTDSSIGNHLRSCWSGPYTIVQLQGSSMVKAIHGILLEGIGGVEADEDRTTAKIPRIYGASESYSLKNVVHASALQSVIINYYHQSQRAYIDSDGTLRTMRLTTPSQPDDAMRVARARDQTALRHMRTTSTSPLQEGDASDGQPTTPDVSTPCVDEGLSGVENDDYEHSSRSSRTSWLTPPNHAATRGDSVVLSEPPETNYDEVSIDRLRNHCGISGRPLFGKFMDTIPTVQSVVISTTAPHIGLARVIDDSIGGDYIKLQALSMVEKDGIITTPEIEEIDPFNVDYHSVVYVRPTASTWTRTRGKQLRELLTDIASFLPLA